MQSHYQVSSDEKERDRAIERGRVGGREVGSQLEGKREIYREGGKESQGEKKGEREGGKRERGGYR